MKINGSIEVPDMAIQELCRRRYIRRMAVFGSALRGELRPDSDLDVLVEFEPGHTPGLVFFEIEAELSALFGRKVDLNTPQFLSPRIRQRVQSEAEVLFAA
jgi:predicted nucleotidyltransferase